MSASDSFMTKSLLDLPLELLTDIFEYLPKPLAPYSTISREFQLLVESITFKDVQIPWTQLPKEFNVMFRSRHRRYTLKQLRILFPNMLHDKGHEQGTSVTISWGQAIGFLLHELSDWEKEDVTGKLKARPTKLDLCLHHCSRIQDGTNSRCLHGWGGISEDNHDTVPIEDVANLPSISFVQGLLYSPARRKLGETNHCLDPIDLIQLSTKFPDLHSFGMVGIGIGQSFTRLPEILRKSQARRIALSKYIHKLPEMNTRLTSLTLLFCENHIPNHTFVPLSLVPSTIDGIDPLSVALHAISRECVNLRSLLIHGGAIVGPELFWPDPSSSPVLESQNQDLIWPNLEKYSLVIHEIAPDGQWYSSISAHVANTPNEGEEDDPTESERTGFNRETFMPLLRAITNAVNHMPKIQCFSLDMRTFTRYAAPQLFSLAVHNIGSPGPVCTCEWFTRSEECDDCSNINRKRWYTTFAHGWEESTDKTLITEDIENGWKKWVGENGLVKIRLDRPQDW